MGTPTTRYRALHISSLFFFYRWLTWLVAVLLVAGPFGVFSQQSPLSGLLLVAAVMTVICTALARPYMRSLAKRPFLVSLDIVVSLLLVWGSGGQMLPFMPFALGALVAPAISLSHRDARIAAYGFTVLDLALLANVGWATITLPFLLLRAVLPTAFVVAWQLGGLIMRSRATTEPLPPRTEPTPGREPFTLNPPRTGGITTTTVRRAARLDTRTLKPGTTAASLIVPPRPRSPIAAPADTPPAPAPELPRRTLVLPAAKLHDSLDALTARFAQSNQHIKTSTVLPTRPAVLSPIQQYALTSVTAAALENIQQHADASNTWLTLRYEAQTVVLTIRDNGVGLLDGTHSRPGMHSLRRLAYQIAEFGGTLTVEEHAGGGVKVQATLPLASEDADPATQLD